MAQVLLFHHALGLTPGVHAFADELRAAGHIVHTPDLFDGETFGTVEAGVAFAGSIGFATLIERAKAAAEDLTNELVYAGFSLGVMPAQMLAQTRPGARAAVLMHAAVPLDEFGGSWPDGVALQIHTMEDDDGGDVEVAQEIAQTVDGAEVFLYPGDRHLFTDRGSPDHDEEAASRVTERVLGLLQRLDV
ncbi:MAG: dienelactone hydrolase family protein [Acidimicrobiales bacterium]